MAPRAVSPALSEAEYDISNALVGGEHDAEEIQGDKELGSLGIDLDGGEDGGSGDEAFIAAQLAASNRKASVKGKTVKGHGSFQSMGLSATTLKAISKKGFSLPTPIQRKTIPFILDRQDVVAMARTGSGKTAAFVIPLVEKLKAHSAKFGARAIILSPSRELALQTLKVVREFGRGTDLRTVLLVGGDSLEDQFKAMTSNPDILLATPGRLLHLIAEMRLDMSAVRYVVFDECDRLFEMGFQTQLGEILAGLPANRQTLLFSATLPTSLVEFARAGLQEPKLIRLDAETKISPDLESAFLTVKSGDRDGALLYILENVIKVPTGSTQSQQAENGKKRKRAQASNANPELEPHSTIVFGATKHRVEYLSSLLRLAGFAVSYVYGQLDQTARKLQIEDFRNGRTNILVVTDVASRGLDLPGVSNVINYDFPCQQKLFVHRVGRTARNGRRGWSYSLVQDTDLPYLIDLHLFLGRKLVFGNVGSDKGPNLAEDVVVGALVRDSLEPTVEHVNKLLEEDEDLAALRNVAIKAESQYTRTRGSASATSARRAKQLAPNDLAKIHPIFGGGAEDMQSERERMLATLSSFRPGETVLELKRHNDRDEVIGAIRKRRSQIEAKRQKASAAVTETANTEEQAPETGSENDDEAFEVVQSNYYGNDDEDPDDRELTVADGSGKPSDDFRSSEFFISYTPRDTNVAEEKAYGVHSGGNSNFVQAARSVQMDLTNDDLGGKFGEPTKARGMRWDKKSKKYVARANDEDGSKGGKMVRGESGLKIAASFRSGRFDAWRKSNKMGRLPRTGEMESSNTPHHITGPRYKHKAEKAPKEADRFRDDYHVQKKRVQEAKEKRIGKFREGTGKNELKGIEDVRKQRQLQEKRREKNARPSKKRKI